MPGAHHLTRSNRSARSSHKRGAYRLPDDETPLSMIFARTPKMGKLLLAMAEHEGWGMPSPGKPNGGTRAYRHHNPGNLRRSIFQHSVIDDFAVFPSDHIGWVAFEYDIMQKAKGNTITGLNGESTIADLLYKWAPPADNNDTEAYIKSVEQKSGLPRTTKLKELL